MPAVPPSPHTVAVERPRPTRHTFYLGDARDLSAIEDESVHLVVTSPPYGNPKRYPGADGQLGNIDEYERQAGYHPRSDKHSNALAVAIVQDLIDRCVPLRGEALAGRLVYDINMDLRFGTSVWNVDLVLGTPGQDIGPQGAIVRLAPATVRVAIEIKSVMTEHRKAVKNRKRDFEAHHEHVHNYSSRAIAGGVLVVNAAERFRSPLREDVTEHGTRPAVRRLVEHCLSEMRNVTERGGGRPGMDAKAALVVAIDDIDLWRTRYVTAPPAPQPGDPLHYDSFIQRLGRVPELL
jgi:hypothetical protein